MTQDNFLIYLKSFRSNNRDGYVISRVTELNDSSAAAAVTA